MNFTHAIIFYDENQPPLKITYEEYQGLKAEWKTNALVEIKRLEETYNRSDVRRIEKLKNPGLPSLPPPPEKTITPGFLEKFKKEMAKRFSVKNP